MKQLCCIAIDRKGRLIMNTYDLQLDWTYLITGVDDEIWIIKTLKKQR